MTGRRPRGRLASRGPGRRPSRKRGFSCRRVVPVRCQPGPRRTLAISGRSARGVCDGVRVGARLCRARASRTADSRRSPVAPIARPSPLGVGGMKRLNLSPAWRPGHQKQQRPPSKRGRPDSHPARDARVSKAAGTCRRREVDRGPERTLESPNRLRASTACQVRALPPGSPLCGELVPSQRNGRGRSAISTRDSRNSAATRQPATTSSHSRTSQIVTKGDAWPKASFGRVCK